MDNTLRAFDNTVTIYDTDPTIYGDILITPLFIHLSATVEESATKSFYIHSTSTVLPVVTLSYDFGSTPITLRVIEATEQVTEVELTYTPLETTPDLLTITFSLLLNAVTYTKEVKVLTSSTLPEADFTISPLSYDFGELTELSPSLSAPLTVTCSNPLFDASLVEAFIIPINTSNEVFLDMMVDTASAVFTSTTYTVPIVYSTPNKGTSLYKCVVVYNGYRLDKVSYFSGVSTVSNPVFQELAFSAPPSQISTLLNTLFPPIPVVGSKIVTLYYFNNSPASVRIADVTLVGDTYSEFSITESSSLKGTVVLPYETCFVKALYTPKQSEFITPDLLVSLYPL